MKLPVADQSYQPTTESLIRAVKRAGAILAQTVADETSLSSGATAFCTPGRPGVRFANLTTDLQVPESTCASAVLDELVAHYDSQGVACLALDGTQSTWPDALAQAARQHGFEPTQKWLYRLERHRVPQRRNDAVQIIPARAAYGQLPAFFRSMAHQGLGADPKLASDLAGAWIDQLDEPRLELFLGRLNGRLVGVAGVVGLGQTGVICPAYTDANHRRQGIAAALTNHTLDHCGRALMQQVILQRTARCPSVPFYESTGFKAIAPYVRYRRP